MLFRIFILGIFLIGCSSLDEYEVNSLEKLSHIEIIADNEYIPNLIKTRVQNSLNKYNIDSLAENKLKIKINISEKIEGSILSNSIRKIEMTADYKIFDTLINKVIYEDSFSRNSLIGPIDSLFSREQSERNARKRLGVSISNDIIIRLIQWAKFSD